MAELLIRLVACETEKPPGRGLAGCAGVLREGRRDSTSPRRSSSSNRPAASPSHGSCAARPATARSSSTSTAISTSSPVQDRAQFVAERRDGKIIGRGTADMKGGIVSMLYGAAAAKELGLLGDGRIVIHLICDEETGSGDVVVLYTPYGCRSAAVK